MSTLYKLSSMYNKYSYFELRLIIDNEIEVSRLTEVHFNYLIN